MHELLIPVGLLSGPARAFGAALVLFALLLAITTPILSAHSFSLASVSFDAGKAQPAIVPELSLWLALVGLATGWTAALAGAALTNEWLFLLMSIFY